MYIILSYEKELNHLIFVWAPQGQILGSAIVWSGYQWESKGEECVCLSIDLIGGVEKCEDRKL